MSKPVSNPPPETSIQFLERIIRTNPKVATYAKHNLDEWRRFRDLRKQSMSNTDRSKRLGNRALWDLLAGGEQRVTALNFAPPQSSFIQITTGGHTFKFHIFAEAQDRRGYTRTLGAIVTGVNPTSHRQPQKKWGKSTLRSYP